MCLFSYIFRYFIRIFSVALKENEKMKSNSIILFLFISFVIGSTSFGQNYEDDKNNTSIESFDSKPSELNFLSVQTFQVVPSEIILKNNNVFISQIGADNLIKVNTQSTISNIDLLQYGNQNRIYLDIVANTIEESVIQNGNNNVFSDYSTYDLNYHSAEIIQTGNNHNLTWFGGNSVSEKIKINMQGESKTIIVRNFN